MDNLIVPVLVILAVSILVFLILREVMCWYWKINERITLQQQTNALLKKLLESGSPVPGVKDGDQASSKKVKSESQQAHAEPPADTDSLTISSRKMIFCTQCGHENKAGMNFCAQCGAMLTD